MNQADLDPLQDHSLLNRTVEAINRIHLMGYLAAGAIRIFRAILLGVLMAAIWSVVQPGQEQQQMFLALVVAAISLMSGLKLQFRRINLSDFALALEMKHPQTNFSPMLLKHSNPNSLAEDEWLPILRQEKAAQLSHEWHNVNTLASTLIVPLIFTIVALSIGQPSFSTALESVANVVSRLNRGAAITVLQGLATEAKVEQESLSTSTPLELELLAQNLIQVDFKGTGLSASPTLELRRRSEEVAEESGEGGESAQSIFQSFQMSPSGDSLDDGRYSITFAVSADVDLYIPVLSANKKLATIKVKKLPIPVVTLKAPENLEDPWPDDQALELTITAEAKNPLQLVQLVIKSGKNTSNELVNRIVAEDKTEFETTYSLILEPYVESDIAEVEIVAEAIDRSLPAPLIGRSNPIRLTTASAYGRYRETLRTLRELKSLVDEALEEQQQNLKPEAKELVDKAGKQAEKSPFFDGLDRVQISRFEMAVTKDADSDMSEMMQLSTDLNNFLFEHEILDDRERDRDYFVAARSLSRLIEQEKDKRPVGIDTVTERIKKFLEDRQQRWKLRTDRLGPDRQPPSWSNVGGKKPFKASMEKITKAMASNDNPLQAQNEALKELSNSVVEYRNWIEELEAKEDESRNEQERERQQGLASARNELRELQKRQGQISAALDKALQREKEEMAAEWPATRMQQNANIKDTRRLENQMRSLSPMAGMRIKAAQEAMEKGVESGNSENYVLAESASDLAGRLLRQAESATRNSQRQQQNRGRRRRVTGDNYYGQSVVGGDIEIKREYQVDRRYREDILDEVQSSSYGESDRVLLDNYLRRIIR